MRLFHFPFCSDLIGTDIDCIEPTGEQLPLKSTLGNALLALTNNSVDLAGNSRSFFFTLT